MVNGIPEGADENDSKELIESFLEEFKQSAGILKNEKEKFAWSFSVSSAIRGGRELNTMEMKTLVNALLETNSPLVNAKGKKIIYQLDATQINQLFTKK